MFLGYPDYFRERAIGKVSPLPPAEVVRSRLPSGWSPLELLLHLRHVERRWLEWGFLGRDENLAVYELIRRRCRVIVACDADADGSYQFDNLVSLIEKARTDFGARIEIDYGSTRPSDGARESQHNCVSGTIYYDPHDPTDTGTLILIKAGMPVRGAVQSCTDRKLPDDVWRYCDQHSTFPHESTGDQWFDEWQFESYRALGEYIGCNAADGIRKAIDDTLQLSKPKAVPIAESSDDLAEVNR